MKVLIVEDNKDQLQSYRDAISAVNEEGGEQIDAVLTEDLGQSLEILEKGNFDAAVIDLKLSDKQGELEGNQIIKQIVGIRRFPVFVYSSFIGDIDPDIPESIFFQKFDRTSIRFIELIKKLRDIYNTGITKILGKNGSIEERLTEIFWNHISGSFGFFVDKKIPQKQLLRYITGHIYEHLELDDADSFENYSPEEVYRIPPVKKGFFTGNIVRERGSNRDYIILTPPCDMVNNRPNEPVLLAAINGIDEEPMKGFINLLKKEIPKGLAGEKLEVIKRQQWDARQKLEALKRNTFANKYYFLPKSVRFKGGLINFQQINSFSQDKLKNDFVLIASVNNQFLKDIIARFAFYYSRQGAPDLDFSIDDL